MSVDIEQLKVKLDKGYLLKTSNYEIEFTHKYNKASHTIEIKSIKDEKNKTINLSKATDYIREDVITDLLFEIVENIDC